MDADFDSLLAESTNLELQVADLYSLFRELFPEDASFWEKLHAEEINHASLLRSVRECFKPLGLLPYGMLAPTLLDLKDINAKLSSLLKKCRRVAFSRQEAFSLAFELEQSAGEVHFQNFMDSVDATSEVEEVFKRLNSDDKDHARRISAYMTSHEVVK